MSFLIAHRGHSARAPENTMAAFRSAADAGFGWIETDVDLLGDATPVLLHDGTLDRTTDATGPLSGLSRSDLARIDAGSWFHEGPLHAAEDLQDGQPLRPGGFVGERIPLLSQLVGLANARSMDLNLELKLSDPTPERIEAYLEVLPRAIAGLDAGRSVLISSFDHQLLTNFHEQVPDLPTACLFEPREFAPGGREEGWREAVRATGASYVHPHHSELDRDTVRRIHAAKPGLGVNTWTVNDRGRARKLASWGVAGLCTDGPERVVRQFAKVPSLQAA